VREVGKLSRIPAYALKRAELCTSRSALNKVVERALAAARGDGAAQQIMVALEEEEERETMAPA
jgi:hypothetical protein